MQVVYPAHEFRNLHGRDVEIDNKALLPASCQHAVKPSILARVDLLMRHVGRDVDEIPRRGLGDEFQAVRPLCLSQDRSLHHAAALCSVRAARQTSRAASTFIAAMPSPTNKSGQPECV